jgi:hypothetical protein
MQQIINLVQGEINQPVDLRITIADRIKREGNSNKEKLIELKLPDVKITSSVTGLSTHIFRKQSMTERGTLILKAAIS